MGFLLLNTKQKKLRKEIVVVEETQQKNYHIDINVSSHFSYEMYRSQPITLSWAFIYT